jgi:hypothetical protein
MDRPDLTLPAEAQHAARPPVPARSAGAERHDRLRAAERRIAAVTRLLDDAVEIPGTRHRIGLDAIVGLIPGVGDLVSAAVGTWIVAEATRFRLPRVVVARMVLNSVADLVIGVVPVLGDLFDVAFRSNRKNLELFRRHVIDPNAGTGGDRAFLVGLLLIALGLISLLALGVGALLSVQIPPP